MLLRQRLFARRQFLIDFFGGYFNAGSHTFCGCALATDWSPAPFSPWSRWWAATRSYHWWIQCFTNSIVTLLFELFILTSPTVVGIPPTPAFLTATVMMGIPWGCQKRCFSWDCRCLIDSSALEFVSCGFSSLIDFHPLYPVQFLPIDVWWLPHTRETFHQIASAFHFISSDQSTATSHRRFA